MKPSSSLTFCLSILFSVCGLLACEKEDRSPCTREINFRVATTGSDGEPLAHVEIQVTTDGLPLQQAKTNQRGTLDFFGNMGCNPHTLKVKAYKSIFRLEGRNYDPNEFGITVNANGEVTMGQTRDGKIMFYAQEKAFEIIGFDNDSASTGASSPPENITFCLNLQ
ncbi:MAG: hypothetical protein ACFB10_17010 [Salibacteraceae bacterium]